MNERPILKPDLDKPIEKPFEQLPDWFVDMLSARLTTKKFHHDHVTAPGRGQGHASAFEKTKDH